MNNEPHPATHEMQSSSHETASESKRFNYLLTEDAAVIVDQWKELHHRIDEVDCDDPAFTDLDTVCCLLGSELVELTQVHPRRAAELTAEILRRGDMGFSHFAHTENAILYLAGQDRELAAQVWAMFVELCSDEIDESAQNMGGELRKHLRNGRLHSGDESAEVEIDAPDADRAAMAMFYVEHVSRYNTL